MKDFAVHIGGRLLCIHVIQILSAQAGSSHLFLFPCNHSVFSSCMTDSSTVRSECALRSNLKHVSLKLMVEATERKLWNKEISARRRALRTGLERFRTITTAYYRGAMDTLPVNDALKVNDKSPNALSMLFELELKNDEWVKAKETLQATSDATDRKHSYVTLSLRKPELLCCSLQ
ncbi:hypothetical protein KIW84_041451 [Lathyrus oleraceus]|uniref:Uncharacterized protein n=1 Tax=Pisum sativum TaxID=3888 RepID=A0A9D4X876_PEA|nr:hypothetical protein KIW84_041451 [Pisum sativum]